MKRIRWGRVSLILIILLALVFAIIYGRRLLSLSSGMPDDTSSKIGTELKLPEMPLTPATMTNAQKDAAIEQARLDAIAAAKATGQSDVAAEIAGKYATEVAQRAFYPSDQTSGGE